MDSPSRVVVAVSSRSIVSKYAHTISTSSSNPERSPTGTFKHDRLKSSDRRSNCADAAKPVPSKPGTYTMLGFRVTPCSPRLPDSEPLGIGEKNLGGPPVSAASRSSRVTPRLSPRPCRAMLCTKVSSPAARGAAGAGEEDAGAPARPEGSSPSSVASAGVEAGASTAGSSSLGGVAVSTARRAVRRDLGTADVTGDAPETRRPWGTLTRGARDGAPAAAAGGATANIPGRRGARRGLVVGSEGARVVRA